jgi:hypothetical protein
MITDKFTLAEFNGVLPMDFNLLDNFPQCELSGSFEVEGKEYSAEALSGC